MLSKLICFCKIGGLKLPILKILDKVFKTDSAKKYMYDIFSSADESDYPRLLKLWYYASTGENLNLENPQTFNEKIQWLKLYDSTPLKTRLADKYLVRDWIKEKIGDEYLVPLLGVWDKFDDIDFDALPNQFALKCNHSSGMNVIVTDKSKLNFAETKEKFDKWLKTNYAFVGGLELHYKNIPPKIIAEKYLKSDDGLIDYRFYCMNGMPVQCWVDKYSGTPAHVREIFDMKWNKLDMRCKWPYPEGEFKKPENFELMMKFSEILSKDFCFVRVDFFETEGKLYMGEMTFTPMSGTGKFIPSSWNLRLGKLLNLPQM